MANYGVSSQLLLSRPTDSEMLKSSDHLQELQNRATAKSLTEEPFTIPLALSDLYTAGTCCYFFFPFYGKQRDKNPFRLCCISYS